MRLLIVFLLLCACSNIKVKGYTKSQSLIKVCGNALSNFDDIEDEAYSICGRTTSVLQCDYTLTGYIDVTPIKSPCCIVHCPEYSNRRRHD